VSVPVTLRSLRRYGCEAIEAEVKKFGAQRVFIALGYYQLKKEARQADIDDLRAFCRFFREAGYEVGAWIWTFCFQEKIPFHPMTPLRGAMGDDDAMACPLDRDFLNFSYEYIRDIAGTGVDVVMFDDDFRYGFLGDSPACLCDLHVAKINALLGETLTREQLAEKILAGGQNKYRDAWLKCNGDAFRAFARNARAAVDSVDPAIRLGACACMTAWDIDGVTASELATILAGATQPFVRLIGAPYWAFNRSWGNDVQDVVELERMESAWTRFPGLEIFAEGDAYPRPRIACPAAFLEGFDTAIRASGCTDGILKYGVDYNSRPGEEDGYARMHRRNEKLYGGIDRHFGGKKAAGVRIYEYPQKVAQAVLPTLDGAGDKMENLFFSQAARVLSHNGIPSTYEGTGVTGMAFGENARHLTENDMKKGLILDIAAAKILEARGIDVGLASLGEKVSAEGEEFPDGNYTPVYGAWSYDISLKEGAQVLSTAQGLPRSYRYENEGGLRFLVLNLVTDRVDKKAFVWKHPARGRQIGENVPWLSGEQLPAWVPGYPNLYLQCRQDATSLTVGLWNLFPDPVWEPEVLLAGKFTEAEFLNTTGTLSDDRVTLEEIPPYGFAAFTLYK
jgi:hypothetical protein